MADMTLPEVITRFRGNEGRINDFTNGNSAGYYTTIDGKQVETLPSLVTRLAAAIAAASATRNDLAATTGSTLVGHGSVTLKAYLDAQATAQGNIKTTADAALPKTGGTLTGSLLLKGPPSQALEAVTKSYADLLAMQSGYQEFTSSGTFNKPDGAKFIYVEAVGAGAGGSYVVQPGNNSSYWIAGGDGGAFNAKLFRASDIPSSVSIVTGVGGKGGTFSSSEGKSGSATTFGSLLQAAGSYQTISYAAQYGYTAINREWSFGGSLGGSSIKGGGSGGNAYARNEAGTIIYGAAPGGASSDAGAGGAANNSASTPGQNGVFPGGGGGGCNGGTKGGDGANGRVRIWWWG
ncbi:hypothetical protein [Pseudomonas oryzihabitans]|uniref:glycine-rich domain-containing protein n=1 Tax=Pseudomonas oryzihabitans TaxID=47885 RepID=UPI0011243607|nr:hypothetical protein [Pseudomonas psychrotolerans]QDD91330.1 hypothetical protein CCZ28_20860 [Pseudomonas psychrotolerans]